MAEKKYFSYNRIHDLTHQLGDAVQHMNFDYIVAVARGGLLPGTILSYRFNKPLRPLMWSTRDLQQQTHDATVVEDLYDGSNILLIDDINDTGTTFKQILEDWTYDQAQWGGSVITASVFQRYSTSQPSDKYAMLIEDESWIVFPWEEG